MVTDQTEEHVVGAHLYERVVVVGLGVGQRIIGRCKDGQHLVAVENVLEGVVRNRMSFVLESGGLLGNLGEVAQIGIRFDLLPQGEGRILADTASVLDIKVVISAGGE